MNKKSSISIKDGGEIGIYYLKKIWNFYAHLIQSNLKEEDVVEWKYINGVFNALSLGIEPTIQYLTQASPSFQEFENWIRENGKISGEIINHFNSLVNKEKTKGSKIEEKPLSNTDLEKWDRDGYVILKDAIPKEDCERAVKLIYEKIGATQSNPESWYNPHPLKQGIMIQLFNSPILDKNRLSRKIRLTYEQLWNRPDLMVSMDRVSFNPPETAFYQFPGPNLHWDISLKRPIPFGLQGLLYLADTDKTQGAFTVIRGFHKKLEDWLEQLGQGVDPRDQKILSNFELDPISGDAGDFIIWDHRLPHGSSPNKSSKPRIVQYINYQPLDLEFHNEWI